MQAPLRDAHEFHADYTAKEISLETEIRLNNRLRTPEASHKVRGFKLECQKVYCLLAPCSSAPFTEPELEPAAST